MKQAMCSSKTDDVSRAKRRGVRLFIIISKTRPNINVAVLNLVLWGAIILLCPKGAHPTRYTLVIYHTLKSIVQSTRLIEITFSCINQTTLHIHYTLDAFNAHTYSGCKCIHYGNIRQHHNDRRWSICH